MSRGATIPSIQRPPVGTLPVPHPPLHVPHLSPPSWSEVASQLRTLVFGSPIITTAITVIGAAAIALTYAATMQQRRRRLERRRVIRQVKSDFKTYRLDIIKYISEQEWNHFTIQQLTQLYDIFAKLLDNPRRGVLPISALTSIIRANGIEDDHVAHACARFFDMDGNWQVDFIELIERLNLLQFGPKLKKLEALFSVYDLDGSGRISRAELEQVLIALGHRDKEQAHIMAQKLFNALDEKGELTQSGK
jgi:Ca2+-binding EF-hand superfamily protein